MDPVIIATGFAVYFLLIVISYMLLSNPEIDQLWGGILLAFSLVAVSPAGYALEEYTEALAEFVSKDPLILAMFFLAVLPLLYTAFKHSTPPDLKEAFPYMDLMMLIISVYGVFLFVFLIIYVILPFGAIFAMIILHFFVCRKVLKLATLAREKRRNQHL